MNPTARAVWDAILGMADFPGRDGDRSLALVLASFANEDGTVDPIPYTELAAVLSTTPGGVENRINSLRKLGIVEVEASPRLRFAAIPRLEPGE